MAFSKSAFLFFLALTISCFIPNTHSMPSKFSLSSIYPQCFGEPLDQVSQSFSLSNPFLLPSVRAIHHFNLSLNRAFAWLTGQFLSLMQSKQLHAFPRGTQASNFFPFKIWWTVSRAQPNATDTMGPNWLKVPWATSRKTVWPWTIFTHTPRLFQESRTQHAPSISQLHPLLPTLKTSKKSAYSPS